MTFKDHFSRQSDVYAKYRPGYPDSLFQEILSHVELKDLAWDCATGNGQAAKFLAPHFVKIIATDASEKQIKNANPIENVEFLVGTAEKTGFEDHSVDLITVAQAAHWFDLPKFYEEVKRVIKPEGILAIWTYELFQTQTEIQKVIDWFYFEIMYDYWPPERRLVESGYRDLFFPFDRIQTESIRMSLNWSYNQVIGYLNTWSAVKNYKLKEGSDPVKLAEEKLSKEWKNKEETISFNWNLPLLMTRF